MGIQSAKSDVGSFIGKMMWFLQQINSRKEAGGRCEVEGGGKGEVATD